MNLFKDYYCHTYEEDGYYTRRYLFITRRDTDARVTSFRIENEIHPYNDGVIGWILIKYNAHWETFAHLIVEYCINDLKISNIYLDDMYDGN